MFGLQEAGCNGSHVSCAGRLLGFRQRAGASCKNSESVCVLERGPLPCQGSGCLGHVGVKLAMPEARNGTLCREATKAAIHIVATLKKSDPWQVQAGLVRREWLCNPSHLPRASVLPAPEPGLDGAEEYRLALKHINTLHAYTCTYYIYIQTYRLILISHIYLYIYIYICIIAYIHIYIYTHTHTHTRIYKHYICTHEPLVDMPFSRPLPM